MISKAAAARDGHHEPAEQKARAFPETHVSSGSCPAPSRTAKLDRSSIEDNARQLVDALHESKDVCPGHRVNHASGLFLEGRFVASEPAAALTSATVMSGAPVMALLRFSDSSGSPVIDQSGPRADPRGVALRLTAIDGSVTDLVGHSIDGFPAATPAEFLKFLSVLAAREAKPDAFERYLDTNPSAARFVMALASLPHSYAAKRYHMLHAFVLTSALGIATVGRLTVEPTTNQGQDDEKGVRGPDFLHHEMRTRILKGPVVMNVVITIAAAGDPLDDITERWPEDRARVRLGTIVLDCIAPDQGLQRRLMFDPATLGPGIKAAGDPMFAVRSEVYRQSFARRYVGPDDLPRR